MSSQEFLWLNLGAAGLLLLIFLVGRSKQRPPSRLKMKDDDAQSYLQSKSAYLVRSKESLEAEFGPEDGTRALNVIFMHNGHTWDAYEVLGVPAGCNLKMAEEALALALSRHQADSHEFLRSAFKAIADRSHHRNRA